MASDTQLLYTRLTRDTPPTCPGPMRPGQVVVVVVDDVIQSIMVQVIGSTERDSKISCICQQDLFAKTPTIFR